MTRLAQKEKISTESTSCTDLLEMIRDAVNQRLLTKEDQEAVLRFAKQLVDRRREVP
jgi:hypothetical protein